MPHPLSDRLKGVWRKIVSIHGSSQETSQPEKYICDQIYPTHVAYTV